MRSILFFLLISCLSPLHILSQYDTLILTNGTKQVVILKEIGNKNVKYKLPADSLGPTYIIQKRLITKFILNGGCIDLKDKGYLNCVKDPTFGVIQGKDFKRTLISTDLSQLLIIQHFQLNIEHVLKNRKLGFEIYFNKGLRDRKFQMDYDRKEIKVNPVKDGTGYYKYAYAGFNVRIYPYAHKKFTFRMGLGLETGKASAYISKTQYISYSWGTSTYVIGKETKTSYYETHFLNQHLNLGLILRPSRHFFMGSDFIIGPTEFINPVTMKTDFNIKWGVALNMGLAF